MKDKSKRLVSIVTPCFNEEANVEQCHDEVRRIFEEELPDYDFEHIFVDNNSNDGTMRILRKMAKKDLRVKVISNSRNIGPFRSMWNGLKNSSGHLVIPFVPADLQDPPAVIPKLIAEFSRGNLVVYGIRAKRIESWYMKFARKFYYILIHKLSGSEIPLNAGEFLLADRRIIDSILEIDDEYPYIRGLIALTGAKSSFVEYTWEKRAKGVSKNNFISLIDQAVNGLLSTSRIPARFALLFGIVFSFISIISAVILLLLFVFNPTRPAMGIPTLIVSGLFLSGAQLFFLGVVGEYVLSIHSQVRKRPKAFDVERINFRKEKSVNRE